MFGIGSGSFGGGNSGNMFSGSSNTRSIYPSQNMFGNNQQLSGNNPYQNWMGGQSPKLMFGGNNQQQIPIMQQPQQGSIGPSFDIGELIKRIMAGGNPGNGMM